MLLAQKIGQAVVPGCLVSESEVCVSGAWVWDYEEPSGTDGLRLRTQNSRNARSFERGQRKRPVSCEAMKASHTRRITMQLFQKNWDPCGEVTSREFRCIAGRTLNHVCKPDSETRQVRIVPRQERINPELPPDAFTQLGAGECRPETAGGTSKVMSLADRVEAGIDPDENEIESRTKIVRQGGEIVLLRHGLHDWSRIQVRVNHKGDRRDRRHRAGSHVIGKTRSPGITRMDTNQEDETFKQDSTQQSAKPKPLKHGGTEKAEENWKMKTL
jgi:hypothetical protein